MVAWGQQLVQKQRCVYVWLLGVIACHMTSQASPFDVATYYMDSRAAARPALSLLWLDISVRFELWPV
jgi:hypothetical protein